MLCTHYSTSLLRRDSSFANLNRQRGTQDRTRVEGQGNNSLEHDSREVGEATASNLMAMTLAFGKVASRVDVSDLGGRRFRGPLVIWVGSDSVGR